ncbi:phage tail protein [Lancefieldella rimae]|nr:phage tail protein [Lancefieldella rimae]
MNYAGQVLHNPRTDTQILSAELKEESGQSPTLTFKIAPTHPLWSAFGHDAVMAIEREVELKEVESGEVLFRGRVRSVSMPMDGAKKIVCEGSLAYLNDTTVRPYKTYDTTEIDCPINAPAEADKLFLWFIDQHNTHVANRCKRFRVGINAGINYGRLSRGTGSRPTTIKEMRDKLTKLCGGYFRVRYDDYGSLVDWLPSRGAAESTQAVELGQNLLDLSTGTDGKDLFTAIVPVGKAGEGEHEHDVTIDDGEQDGVYVAVSPDYYILGDAIVDKAKAERYGVIEKTIQYHDISDKKQLAEKAMAELAAARFDDAIEVSAFDLHYADKSIRPINFLERVSVKSKPHELSRMMLCVGRTIDICDPTHSKYKFGAIASTLTKEGTTAQDDADAQQRRVTALSASTRTIAEDAKKTTIKVAEVDDRAVKATTTAEEAKKTVVKVEEQVTTAAKKADAAASKVEEVSTKAEKAAQAVTTVVSDVAAAKAAATEAKKTADAAGQEAHDAKTQAKTAATQAAAVDGKATEAKQMASAAGTVATQAEETATAAKQAVDKLSNAFSTDAEGAHVGSKAAAHTTIDAQGLHVMSGAKEIATIAQNTVALAKGATEAEISMVDSAFNLNVKRENNPDIGVIQDAVFTGESFSFNPHYSYTTMSSVLKFAAIESEINRGIEVFIKPQGYEVAYIANENVLSSATGTHKHLINLLTVTPWVTMRVTDGSNVIPKAYVKWRIYGGFLLLDVYVPAGYSGVHTVEKLPEKWRPADSNYVVLATQQAEGTAGVWVDGVGGSYGDIWIYNSARGYCSGLAFVMPKAFA